MPSSTYPALQPAQITPPSFPTSAPVIPLRSYSINVILSPVMLLLARIIVNLNQHRKRSSLRKLRRILTHTVSLPTPLKLVLAFKGIREKLRASPKKLTMYWAPNVYGPIPKLCVCMVYLFQALEINHIQ